MLKSFLRYAGFLIALVGIFLFVTLYPHWNSAFSVPFRVNANEFPNRNFLREGTAIDAELTMIMDSFASETVESRSRLNVLGTTRYEYNIVPVFIGDDTYFVGIRLSETQLKDARVVIDNTENFLRGNDVVFDKSFDRTATIVSMENELYEYMKDWFVEIEWFATENEINQYVLPLVIEMAEKDSVKNGIFVALGLIVTGVAVFIITFFMDGKYRRRAKALRKCDGIIESNCFGMQISIPVKELDDVDKAMWKGNRDKARKILIKTYKATEDEADDIVNRWVELTTSEEMR